ncbi:uncharacterized protein LOC9324527 isoform X1 [Arabidopsis lyrata subsp. lyrata]|uniref:uncharacterized protein LOC9324527 isoform X1 n=1 Tax=Arabidopsis lyrata subsp. lyrata TaxID=81972 RepID=UPI000A29B46B|nr:uncharacterized protein LOC9324527 isoform X1 [Arabidopsis lyrata subsp. lyrata]XP_020891499.1 uncharacterized protein LOC9324527 isoform X1 [Arabidopsis lyrata subsp. lyrata]|eukprot:XP_020891498.1 uncharacterized protein LOC9324527 isoform X1 [Arabidopsis lyrata subsp. lyrata]
MCARHIYANLRKNHPHRADMKSLFWKVAKSYNEAQYEKSLEKLKAYDMNVFNSVMQKNPKNYSLTFFKPTASCDDVSNNISESFNHAIDPARVMPLVEMLETIRRRAMIRIDIRRKKAMSHKGKYSLKAMEKLELEQKKTKNCKVNPCGVGEYEVKEKKSSFKVYMEKHSCTCRRWHMSGLPCRHALKVILDNKKLKRDDYISSCYLTSRWRNQYNAFIKGVRGMNFWKKSGEIELLPPKTDTTKGRKPIPKRFKERNESPQKKKKKTMDSKTTEIKVSREKRIIHCGSCGEAGHNTRSCKNVGVIPPKKSKGKTAKDGCEGPSQLTQSQVID